MTKFPNADIQYLPLVSAPECFLIAHEDRPTCVMGMLVCLVACQDEGLGCSELDIKALRVRKQPICVSFSLSAWDMMDECPELNCSLQHGVRSKRREIFIFSVMKKEQL